MVLSDLGQHVQIFLSLLKLWWRSLIAWFIQVLAKPSIVLLTVFCRTNLKAYRITDTFLNWLSSYLHIRFFFVAVNGFKSVVYELTFEVPQGSYMGPILFNIFIYGLSNSSNYCSQVFMYADDPNTTSEGQHLAVVKWCTNNKKA